MELQKVSCVECLPTLKNIPESGQLTSFKKHSAGNFVNREQLDFPRHFDLFAGTESLSLFLMAVITGTGDIYCATSLESSFPSRDFL